MGVRPSRHASRVSAADTRDPSVLGSETSALRRAANCAARGFGISRRSMFAPSKRASQSFPGACRGGKLHQITCPGALLRRAIIRSVRRAACGRARRAARTHTPRSCPPTAHAARPPCLLMVTTSVLTCHTRVYVLGPHIRQFPVLPSARLCCTSAPRHARNRRSSAL